MPKLRTNLVLVVTVFIMATACAPKTQFHTIDPGKELELSETPFFPQSTYQCGPASLAMILGASGVMVHPDVLAPLTYLPARRGSLQLDLIGASRKYGRIPYEIDPELSALIEELRGGHPVLVLQNYGLKTLPVYHYAVVIGATPDAIILRSGTNHRIEMGVARFLMSWRRTGSWGLIVLKPGDLPAQIDAAKYLKAVAGFESSGQLEQAEQGYLAALRQWPKDHTAMFALANNSLARGKLVMAALRFREILSDEPNHAAAANNLAETFVQRGCTQEAYAVITKAVDRARIQGSPLLATLKQTRQEIYSSLQETGHKKKPMDKYSDTNIHEIVCSN